MGQGTVGIMYGIEQGDSGHLMFGEEYSGGLIGMWRDECFPRIEAWRKRNPGRITTDGLSLYVPDGSYGNHVVIGFWIAVRNPDHGVIGLGTVDISAIKTTEPYATAYKKARRRWNRFAKWCAAKGYVMPKARLWIAETEVA